MALPTLCPQNACSSWAGWSHAPSSLPGALGPGKFGPCTLLLLLYLHQPPICTNPPISCSYQLLLGPSGERYSLLDRATHWFHGCTWNSSSSTSQRLVRIGQVLVGRGGGRKYNSHKGRCNCLSQGGEQPMSLASSHALHLYTTLVAAYE